MTTKQEIDAVIGKLELFRKRFSDEEIETILAAAAQPAQDGPSVSRAKRAFYWKFVSYGTARQAPDRFIDRARGKSAVAVLAKLKSGIRKYADKNIQQIFD